jgi:hypothetical protein
MHRRDFLTALQPTRLDLAVNQPVAPSLGIALPRSIFALAEKVIK